MRKSRSRSPVGGHKASGMAARSEGEVPCIRWLLSGGALMGRSQSRSAVPSAIVDMPNLSLHAPCVQMRIMRPMRQDGRGRRASTAW